ncbi:MAG TPA: hypothetical protein VL307_19010 [Chitinophagaceae bacterium]|nr:hypothetical protein [Chitinophagaceae bacterium]
MTKRIIVLSMVLFYAAGMQAQADSSKVEQYCQLMVTQRMLSNKVTVDIDYGDEKSYWKDSRLTSSDGRLKRFNTIIDAMNYMGQAGWTFISAYPVHIGSTEIFHFAFRKQFSKAGLPQ